MATEAVSVTDLVKRFGSFTAVNRVSFSVAEGEIFGLLGPNGAGKSTTIRMLCGILPPTAGDGHVAGFDLYREAPRIKENIGYMSQKFSLYQDMTCLENIRFYLGIYNVPEADWTERTGWAVETAQLGGMGHRRAGDLPPGWRQRLALACSLLHRPRILFLDEPTSGVDPMTRRHFWQSIRQLAEAGMTVFVTTHYMEEAMHCHRIVMIDAGRVAVQGAPGKIIRELFPHRPDATLDDVFVTLMKRAAP